MFDCSICQHTLVEPTGLPSCPHTFCNQCIIQCQKKDMIKCPTCRIESHVCGVLSSNLLLQEFIDNANIPNYDIRKKEYLADKNLNDDILKYCKSKYCYDLFIIILEYLTEHDHGTFDEISNHLKSKLPDRNVDMEMYIVLSREDVPLIVFDDKILKNDHICVTNFIKKEISNISTNNLMFLILQLEPGIIDINLENSPLQLTIRNYVYENRLAIANYLEKIIDKCVPYIYENESLESDLIESMSHMRQLILNQINQTDTESDSSNSESD